MHASLSVAAEANRQYALALEVFTANAKRFDFARAEAEREGMHSLLDVYLDNFMAAQRRLQAEAR